MNKLRINIILPFPVTKPVGGARVMYEYANRLHALGHIVQVFHSIKRPFKKSSTPLWYKRLMFRLRNVSRPKWFQLDQGIRSLIVPEINDKNIPDADITMSTWWQMTYAVAMLSASKGKKFSLVQDYEIWAGHVEKVDASFSLPVQQLVIAKYLQVLVTEKNAGIVPTHIPNAIDNKQFFTISPSTRDTAAVIMLYSQEPRKDSGKGLEALAIVYQRFPGLKVQLFGVYPAPLDLPAYINYIQKPRNLNVLYNQSAIFFSPSLGEGWALPPAEAMACGCAVVCTDIGGHHDYAIDGQTALLVRPGDAVEMAEKIYQLLTNQVLRAQIANAGTELITSKFSWDQSVNKLESCFYEAINK